MAAGSTVWGNSNKPKLHAVESDVGSHRANLFHIASSFGDSGDPPDNGSMEARVVALEEFAKDARDRLVRIEGKLDHAATKADLSDAITGQIKWMVGTAAVLGAAAISVMTFVLNNAIPRPPSSPAAIVQPPQQPPIIINVPAPVVPTTQGRKQP